MLRQTRTSAVTRSEKGLCVLMTRKRLRSPARPQRNIRITEPAGTPRVRLRGGFRIERLNSDTSFLIVARDGTRLVVDPWLVGAEIDGAAFFNRAEHTDPVVHPSSILECDAIIISLQFSDHCHEDTILLFPDNVPIFGSAAAIDRLRKHPILRRRSLCVISDYASPTTIGFVQLFTIPTSGLLDFTHGGLVFQQNVGRRAPALKPPQSEYIVYAPHGLICRGETEKVLRGLRGSCRCLMITCSLYCPPLLLGGAVNLGLEPTLPIVELVSPHNIIDCHSEQKLTSGLIPFLSQTNYPTTPAVEKFFADNGVNVRILTASICAV